MPHVLFLCTGNYYRSRFAEELFNALAAAQNLAWRAESCGLRLNPANPGPISRHTLAALEARGIQVPRPLRWPRAANEADFAAAALVVALKEAEHRPLVEQNFPGQLSQVEFWHIHDVDAAEPHEALPELVAHVERLLARLAKAGG